MCTCEGVAFISKYPNQIKRCQTSSASCLAVSEDFIFCGCADGVTRVFNPSNLQYIATLHRPHRLGVDLTQSVQHR